MTDTHVTRIEVYVAGQNDPAGAVVWWADTKRYRAYCDRSATCEWDWVGASLKAAVDVLLDHIERCEAGE